MAITAEKHGGFEAKSAFSADVRGKSDRLLANLPRYNKTRCFETFPFPSLTDGPLKDRLRDLGERLDAHRKSRQAAHPDLTFTRMYNVLEKLRTGESLRPKDKTIHDQGLVTLLKQIHGETDAAVLEAYGWGDLLETQDTRGEDEKAQVSECGGKRERDTASSIPQRRQPANSPRFTPRGGR